MGRIVRAIFGCAHYDTFRERRGNVLYLVCPSCDKSWPAIDRTTRERRQMKKRWPSLKATRARRTGGKAPVYVMPKRGPR